MTRRIHIHAYASVKGGVGKSTMALLSAHLLDRLGHQVVLMDLDCLGTSLADVEAVSLQAPVLRPRNDAPTVLDLGVAPDAYMSWPDAMAARQRRALREEHDVGGAAELPFLNDALFLAEEFWPPNVDALLWTWPGHPNTRVVTSSSTFLDINNMSKWLIFGHSRTWARRVWQLTMALIEQRPSLTHLVLDLPPGLHGYALEAFYNIGFMAEGRDLDDDAPPAEQLYPNVEFKAYRNIVVTPDPQDLAMGVDALRLLRPLAPDLEIVLNRTKATLADAWDRVEPVIGALVAGHGIRQSIRGINDDRGLGRVFQDLSLDTLDESLVAKAVDALRLRDGGI